MKEMRVAQKKPLAVTGALFTAGLAVGALGLVWSYLDSQCYFSDAVRRTRCLDNLARIAKGKEEYRTTHDLTNGALVATEEFIELVDGGWPATKCPGGEAYTLGAMGEKPVCDRHGVAP
jgi:hypothetical protein